MGLVRRLSLGPLATVLTLIVIGVVLFTSGQQMFSPGALNAQSRTQTPLGGVSSHAAIGGNCAACHVSPWSGETMSSRCLSCHSDVGKQIDSHGPMHGLLTEPKLCRNCHTEHKGAHASITDLSGFDHNCSAFKLTGRHTSVRCASCHLNNIYKGTSHTCAACHAEPQVHLGKFGLDCAKCHVTVGWDDVTFEHKFPMNHGGGGKKNKACNTCHQTPNYLTYTCYGCHKHDQVKTDEKHLKKNLATAVNIHLCADCHPGGRKNRRADAGRDGPTLACLPGTELAGSVCVAARGLPVPGETLTLDRREASALLLTAVQSRLHAPREASHISR